MASYYIRNKQITGIFDSRQTIYFADLEDVGGQTIPDSFDAVPKIAVLNARQDRKAIIPTITKTYFIIYLSEIGDLGSDCYFDFLIEG